MFIVTWLFDKIGFMPKVSVDTTWPFPATQQDYKPHPDEVKKPARKVAKNTSVKIPKATTRKPKTK